MKWLPAAADGGYSSLTFDATPDAEQGAVGAVYRTVTIDGRATTTYWYDADGRRRLKQYLDGTTDEFFYEGTNLIEDRGTGSPIVADGGTNPSPGYTLDEYVWVGGRPVAMLKTSFDLDWNRPVVDSNGDCRRAWQAWASPAASATGTCGHFFPVTDYLGKPVATGLIRSGAAPRPITVQRASPSPLS